MGSSDNFMEDLVLFLCMRQTGIGNIGKMRFKSQLPSPDAEVDSKLESELSECQIKSHPQRQAKRKAKN